VHSQGILIISIASFSINNQANVTDDSITTHYFQRCKSKHHLHFLVAIMIEKGSLLILGIFLAWETRKVNIPVLNDSRYIGKFGK